MVTERHLEMAIGPTLSQVAKGETMDEATDAILEGFSQDSDTYERFLMNSMEFLNEEENAYLPNDESNGLLKLESAPEFFTKDRASETQKHRDERRFRDRRAEAAEGNEAFWDADEIKQCGANEQDLDEKDADSSISSQGDGFAFEHACRYCGIHGPDSVVKCNANDCQRWFCNSTAGSNGSHIVNHLVRSKHKEVVLHADSSIGETALECYNCGSKNVFLLGFIPAPHEGIILIICREPCLTNNATRDSTWDISQWQPLIEDRSFLSWLVTVPSTEESRRARHVTMQDINSLELRWKSDPTATINDLHKQEVDKAPRLVQLKYADAYEYHNIFAPLVSAEAKYQKEMMEGRKQENVTLRWDIGLNFKRYAHFLFRRDETELRMVVSDELKLSHPNFNGKRWECVGQIARMSSSDEIALELNIAASRSGPWDKSIVSGYTVESVFKSTPFVRSLSALRRFVTDDLSVSGYLYHKLLGHPVPEQSNKVSVPRHFSAPNLATLNHSQIAAVERALRSPLCLIQGPPGTGKTLSSATIVYHLAMSGVGPILVTSPSNVAVDQLAYKIHQTGLKVLRVCSKTRELLSSPVEFLSLHKQILKVKTASGEELLKLLALKEEIGELSVADGQRLIRLRSVIEYDLLRSAQVICTTCIGAGDPRLRGFTFSQVVIDEATQTTEPECLVPIVMGAKQLILVGDHCQLPPIVLSKDTAKRGYTQSMFERLVFLNVRPVRLEVQYRMHPCLSEFPSAAFYDGSLQNGVTLQERTYESLDFPWPQKDMPMFFYNSTGQEEISASGTSYLNRTEASNIEKLATALLKGGLHPSQIGIITPYDGHRSYIASLFQRQTTMNQSLYQEIEIASVDSFQGREKDFILLSCVRSNQNIGIGFLSDPRRLNVALTRAKYGLIVCGNAKVLASSVIKFQHTIWCNLLNHFKKHHLVVEGPLSNLKPSNIVFPMQVKWPSRYHNATPHDFIDLTEEELLEYDRSRPSRQPPFSASYSAPREGYGGTAAIGTPAYPMQGSKDVSMGEGYLRAPSIYFANNPTLPPSLRHAYEKRPMGGKKVKSKAKRNELLLEQTYLTPDIVYAEKQMYEQE